MPQETGTINLSFDWHRNCCDAVTLRLTNCEVRQLTLITDKDTNTHTFNTNTKPCLEKFYNSSEKLAQYLIEKFSGKACVCCLVKVGLYCVEGMKQQRLDNRREW